MFWNIFETSRQTAQEKKTNVGIDNQHCYFKPHAGSSWHVFAYFTAYIDLHTDFGET